MLSAGTDELSDHRAIGHSMLRRLTYNVHGGNIAGELVLKIFWLKQLFEMVSHSMSIPFDESLLPRTRISKGNGPPETMLMPFTRLFVTILFCIRHPV